jgi:hypothetical protein
MIAISQRSMVYALQHRLSTTKSRNLHMFLGEMLTPPYDRANINNEKTGGEIVS